MRRLNLRSNDTGQISLETSMVKITVAPKNNNQRESPASFTCSKTSIEPKEVSHLM